MIPGLAQTALLGSSRAEPPELKVPPSIDTLLKQRGPQDPSSQLLDMAACLSTYQRVGQGALKRKLRASQPAESLGVASHSLSRLLAVLLDGRFAELMPDVLARLAHQQQRLPPEHLAACLDRAARVPRLRPLLIPVLGEVGQQLAACQATWAYASRQTASWQGLVQLWTAATLNERRGLLLQTRISQPQRARQLLEHSWKQEPATARTSLIRLLASQLSLDDEPFLETALDDRDHTVRHNAAQLLSGLAGSRLQARMIKHSEDLLEYHQDGIRVHFPDSLSPALQRDGVQVRLWKDQQKTQNAQLIDMIAAVPLDHWTKLWETDLSDILTKACSSLWHPQLLNAFAEAANRQSRHDWTIAIVHYGQYSQAVLKLVPQLPLAHVEGLVQTLNHDHPEALAKDHPLLKVLHRWKHAWSDEMSSIFLTRLQADWPPDEDKTFAITLRTTLKQWIQGASLAMLEQGHDILVERSVQSTLWHTSYQEMLAMLSFRRTLLSAIIHTH